MLTFLDHIALFVCDPSAAIERYVALFGCAPVWRGTGDGATHAWFQLDNIGFDIISLAEGSSDDRWRTPLDERGELAMAFATPDIATARRVLERRGIATSDARELRSSPKAPGDKRLQMTYALADAATFGASISLVERKNDTDRWPRSETTVEAGSNVTALDHIVVTTSHPDRAAALYGARLGLELKLDRTNPEWGSRLMFFKCGDLIVEIAHSLKAADAHAADKAWGLSWRVADIAATHARLQHAGFDVSAIRPGRKPGTQVFTVRDAGGGVPTLVIGRI